MHSHRDAVLGDRTSLLGSELNSDNSFKSLKVE